MDTIDVKNVDSQNKRNVNKVMKNYNIKTFFYVKTLTPNIRNDINLYLSGSIALFHINFRF